MEVENGTVDPAAPADTPAAPESTQASAEQAQTEGVPSDVCCDFVTTLPFMLIQCANFVTCTVSSLSAPVWFNLFSSG